MNADRPRASALVRLTRYALADRRAACELWLTRRLGMTVGLARQSRPSWRVLWRDSKLIALVMGAIASLSPSPGSADVNMRIWAKDMICESYFGSPFFRYYPDGSCPILSATGPNNFWCGNGGHAAQCAGSFSTLGPCEPGASFDPIEKRCVITCPGGVQPENGVCPAPHPDTARGACSIGQVRVANPCDPATGNKIQREIDYLGAGPFALRFERVYNSVRQAASWGNLVWRHSFESRLRASAATPVDFADITRPDGSAHSFKRSGSIWVSEADVSDKLERFTDPQGNTTSWKLTIANGDLVETYDATGRLSPNTNRTGATQSLVYSDGTANPPNGQTYEDSSFPLPAGFLIRVEDQLGRTLRFGYNTSARLVRVTDPAGNNIIFTHDGSGNFASVTYPDNKVRSYHYNESQHTSGANLPYALTGITDENNDRYATYKYNSAGRAITTEHAGPVETYSLAYNADGTTAVTDPLGSARTYTFQILLGIKRLSGISGPVGPQYGPASQTYDANANVASRTDWNGNRTCLRHDTARNVETIRGEGLTSACPADLSTWTPTPGTVERKITTEWHPTWRLPTKTCEAKRITTLAYDTKGNMTSRSVQATNDGSGAQGCSAAPVGTARTWTYAYTYGTTNPAVATQIVVNGPRTDVTDTTTYVYEEATGNLLSVANALGHETTFGNYDPHGKPRQITDPNGLVTTLVWDERQRLASQTVGSELTSYTYDGVGQLTRITFPDAGFLEYEYDTAHRLTEVRDNLVNKVTYTLDAMGNRTLEETRDPGGVLKAMRLREYNTLNRLIKDIGGTNPALQITQYGYDNQGNLTSIDGPLTGTPNDLSVLAYDALNRLKDVTNPLSGLTRYAYDGLDQLASVTDPRNNATGYTVSGLGDQTQEASPDRGTTNRLFDAAGNLTSSTDARPKTTTYTYDALNRLAQATFQDATSISYAWDQGTGQKGRLTTITFPGGNTTYTYDAHGRVTQKRDTHSTGRVFTVNYAWNATTGRLTSVTYPKGKVLTFGYNAAGRVTSLTVGSAIIATNITYFPFGAPSGWTWGNSLAVTRSFDLDGRLTSFPLTTTDSRNVTYDAASRITEIKHPTNPALAQTMGYDRLDRLTSWVDASSTRGYGYDANGNRTTLTIGANNYTYTTPATTNRLGSTSGPSPARTFAYDGAGNTTGDGQFTLTYNDRGRLVQAVKGSTTTTYTLDGVGQRVKKTVTSGATYYVYDEEGKLLGEYTNSGALIQEYVWLGAMPIAVLRGTTASPTIFYIYADQVDRPWVITNTANQLRWRWDTSPFGELTANQNPAGLGSFGFNLRFPGQYRDAETGLFYNYFRDYDPQTGRYVQSDPIGLAGGLNTYGYANQNPLSYVDPTGEVAPLLLALPFVGGGASVSSLATSLTVLTGLALAPWAIDQLTDPVLMAKPETPDEEARREYQRAVTDLKERIKQCWKQEERCTTEQERKAKAAECRKLIRELEELLKRPKKWTGPHGDGRPPPTRGR